MTRFTHTQWRDAIQSAAAELAKVALGFSGVRLGDTPASTAGMVGAHIPMVGSPSYELSLVSSKPGCNALASAVLGMDASDLGPRVLADAVGEIVNMLAGGIKRRLTGGELELGLPVFVNGAVEPSDRQSVLAFPLAFDHVETVVVVIGPR